VNQLEQGNTFFGTRAEIEILDAAEDKGSQRIELFYLPAMQCAGLGRRRVNAALTQS
jgi:hypothetical protein